MNPTDRSRRSFLKTSAVLAGTAHLTSGLLGEQYIGLEPGGDPVTIEPGGVIRKTQSAVVLEKLISQFMFSAAEKGAASDK